MKTWITKAKTFLSEVNSEIRKANFPARDELISTTVVVLVTSVVFAVFLSVADFGIQWIMNEVFR